MTTLSNSFTSDGSKFFYHEQAMERLRNGKGQPITCHIMLTDVCQHTCAFCSVQKRQGDSLVFKDVLGFIDILIKYGLRSCILSGGGNPILYKCKKSGKTFNDIVDVIHDKGLEIGLITNGMPLADFTWGSQGREAGQRKSWKGIPPYILDKIKWIRISMSGLDHKEHEVYVPDIDGMKTTLGFSYVAHDIYKEPADPHHGKVSRPLDLISRSQDSPADLYFEERVEELTDEMVKYAEKYKPRYIRLLPNCLEVDLIALRCEQLKKMAYAINGQVDREVAFVQYKPPKAPSACYLGYIHPVLAPSGYVMPCDSHCLNESADHQLGGEPWRICHWSKVADLYEKPIKSLIKDPAKTCPGCVFTGSNELLKGVREGKIYSLPTVKPEHVNFV